MTAKQDIPVNFRSELSAATHIRTERRGLGRIGLVKERKRVIWGNKWLMGAGWMGNEEGIGWSTRCGEGSSDW